MGWNPPQKENPDVLAGSVGQILRSEVMEMFEMEKLFDIDKIGKSGVKFEEQKLEYLNSMHIRNKFAYYEDKEETKQVVEEWRQMLLSTLDSNLHKKIKQVDHDKMLMIMDMLKERIHFYSDLQNHTYFFESPDFKSMLSMNFAKKLKTNTKTKIEILEDLHKIFAKVPTVNADIVNRTCSLYLYENRDRGYKNEDVFFLLRYALSGNPVGGPTGQIAEVLGVKELLLRIEHCL